MSRLDLLRRNSWKIVASVLGVSVVVLLVLNLVAPRGDNAVEAAAPLVPAGALASGCTPVNIGVFAERIHVKCAELFDNGSGGNTIQYFAVSTANAAHVNRMQSLFTTALVSGKKLYLFYNPSDVSGSALGCGASDCRIATAAIVQ